MRLTVRYLAQLRTAAGQSVESIELTDAGAPSDLFELLVQRHASLRHLLLDNGGRPQPTVLVFVGDEQVSVDVPLRDGAEVTLLTPIAGGSSAYA